MTEINETICKMQTVRSSTSSRILRTRCRAVFFKWEETQSHVARAGFHYHSESSRRKRIGTIGDVGRNLYFFLGDGKKLRWPAVSTTVPSSRPFSTIKSQLRKQSIRFEDKESSEPRKILSLLKDTTAHPVGSIGSAKIKAAKDALEYWVCASAAIPRRRRKRHGKSNHDRHANQYREYFENAKLICSRLALEQKFDETNEAKNTKCDDDDDNDWFRDMTDQWDENEESFSDEFYILRPFLLNRVVDCWRIGWRDGRVDFTPNEMIEWVEEIDNSRSDSRISDNRTLTMIVDGICLRGDSYEAPLLAQWLLDRRLGQAYENEDDTSLRPDTIFFTNVIRSWAKSGRFEAPEMAEGLLQMMHDLYSKSGWVESAPNAFAYAATMEAWSKSQRHPDSIQRIEALLDEMKNSSLVQVVPDRVSYQYVLNAWADSKTTTGAEKAYDVLQEMIALYEAGNVLVAPNTSNFSRVIKALAATGNDKLVDAVLEQLQDLYSKTGDPNFEPTDEIWRACIIAKAKTGGVAEAQGILDEFVQRAISKSNPNLMPRRGYFIDTLVAWTKTKDQAVAAKMSQKVLDHMIELSQRDASYRNLRPDAKAYDKVILAWSRSRHPRAPDRIEKLLREMERQYDAGDHKMRSSLARYTNLMLAWQRSGRKESTEAIQEIFDRLQSQSKTKENKHLRPDKYIFGILIDSWARRKGLDRVESLFGEMMEEWRNGNRDARPDIRIFHSILRAHSEGNRDRIEATEKCESYLSLMKEVGLPTTIPAYCYLIDVISSKSSADEKDIDRATEVLDELLERIREGTTLFPPKHREYRQFLKTISNSCIPQRNQQAEKILTSLPQAPGPIPKDLLPPIKKNNQ